MGPQRAEGRLEQRPRHRPITGRPPVQQCPGRCGSGGRFATLRELITITDIVSNYAKGGYIELLSLPFGGDEIVIVIVKLTGLPTDAALKNCQYLSDVFTAGAVECGFTHYARIHLTTAATISVNTSTGVRSADIPDQAILAAGGLANEQTGALLICHRKTSGTADNATRLLTKHNFSYTTTGGDLPIAIPSIGSAS